MLLPTKLTLNIMKNTVLLAGITGVALLAASSALKATAQRAGGATSVKTQYAEIGGRKLAYRSVGKGTPIIFCNRFRGVLDNWDPAFVDALAKNYRVILFDYSGYGLSTGTAPTDAKTAAQDVQDLAKALGISKIILGGWSHGGVVAQTAAVRFPQLVSHLVLIGTNPPGENEHPIQQAFFDHALKPVNDLDDEVVLFFEPASPASVQAAKRSHDRIAQRKTDLSIPVPQPLWDAYLKVGADFIVDQDNQREKLGQLDIPILVISGDHEIVFPIENWYALTGKLRNARILMLPQAGHGPQHQYPAFAARVIDGFIKHPVD